MANETGRNYLWITNEGQKFLVPTLSICLCTGLFFCHHCCQVLGHGGASTRQRCWVPKLKDYALNEMYHEINSVVNWRFISEIDLT